MAPGASRDGSCLCRGPGIVAGVTELAERWNHNIHYHHVVLGALPAGSRSALDVGCGDGWLCRQLRERVPHVVGVDCDSASIELARGQDLDGAIDYRCEDFLTAALPAESFDLVTSIAALHHLDPAAALAKMAELLRPGGRLVVIGLARSRLPADLPRELAAVAAQLVHRFVRRQPMWQSPAPTVWPPPHTYPQMRRLAEQALPAVRFRRHLLWRYSLVWTKPLAA